MLLWILVLAIWTVAVAAFSRSQPDEFTSGTFKPVIGDDTVDPNEVERVLLVTGKLTWEVLAERAKREDTRTAVIRVEQLYPRPEAELAAEIARYPKVNEVRWVQDEPENQGAWPHMKYHFERAFDGLPLKGITRPESSTTAVGSHPRHVAEARELLDRAFG